MGAVLRRGYRHVITRLRKFEIENSYNNFEKNNPEKEINPLIEYAHMSIVHTADRQSVSTGTMHGCNLK